MRLFIFVLVIFFTGIFSAGAFAQGAPASDKDIARLIAQFSDDKKAGAALEEVIRLGPAAVNQLKGLALEKQDIVARGWAIAALGSIGGKDAKAVLNKVQSDSDPLVRIWAKAALVAAAGSLDELATIPYDQALLRPLKKRAQELAATLSVEEVLSAVAKMSQLQAPLLDRALSEGSAPLLQAMVSAKDQNVRRMAASYVATYSARGNQDEVLKETLKILAFKKRAKNVPWANGPLFIPQLPNLEKDQARALSDTLLRWMIFCDINKLSAEQNQLHNNLRSINLARVAGYQSPGWRSQDAKAWVQVWRKAYGNKYTNRILSEQNAASRYKAGK